MGIFDTLLGRTRPVQANLDHLFGLSSAQITLQATENVISTGTAGICFKPAVGQAFAATETELSEMLDLGDASGATGTAKVSERADEFGFRWVVVGAAEFDTLVTRVHFVNSTLQDHGYGPTLLCSVFGFRSATDESARQIYLVYLFKRGSFYPFVPLDKEHRDNEAELRLKEELSSDLSIEPDLQHWFPLWSLPFNGAS